MIEEPNKRLDPFEQLLTRNENIVRRWCWRFASGDMARCKDLMQDVYVALWTRRDSLRTGATALQEKAWVRWVCRSVLSHHARKAAPPWVPLADPPEEPEPDSSVQQRELIEELAEAVTPRERELLELLLQGYSIAEAAKRMGMKSESASQMRFRMVQKMKEYNDNRTVTNE